MFPNSQNQQERNLQSFAQPFFPFWLNQAYFYSYFYNFATDLTLQSIKPKITNIDAAQVENALKEENDINIEFLLRKTISELKFYYV